MKKSVQEIVRRTRGRDNSVRNKLNINAFILIFLLFFSGTVMASNIVQFAIDGKGIPFLLDDAGHVWGFKDPMHFEVPVRLSNLEHIKKIAPYIAVDNEGRIFTWTVDDETTSDGFIQSASYTEAKKFGDYVGVTDVAYSAMHFVAVIDHRDIFEWSAAQPYRTLVNGEVIGINSFSPVRKVFSRTGVKAISANTKIVLVANDGRELENYFFGLEALFDDGAVIGWGVSPTGQVEDQTDNHSVILGKYPDAVGLEMNGAHTVILSSTGTTRYLGKCDAVIKESNGSLIQKPGIHVVDGQLADIEKLNSSTSVSDDWTSDIFVKRDGTVWFGFAPNPTSLPGKTECSQFMTSDYYRPAKQISTKIVPKSNHIHAVQVSSSGNGYLMLDSNHNLWSLPFWQNKKEFNRVLVNLNFEGKYK